VKRILLPTDLSDESAAATPYACAMAQRFDAKLHLLYIFEQETGSTYVRGLPVPDSTSEIAQLKQEVAESLANWIAADWEAKIDVLRVTGEGQPAAEIMRYAEENEIDLIVMGTHGRTGIAKALMGSVAEKVVRRSSCPVMTVRRNEHD
jgi:nucleotide-binding universal stress UspA family protein